MIRETLNNGIKLIYKNVTGNITSFTIGFEAGACMEEENEIGVAHALEHMVFKGTNTQSEFQINTKLDELFGFNNAMTNYPYVIYYGTTHREDFEKGIQVYSDILLNPAFPSDSYDEEINIICEELKDWKDDPYQFCEDCMLANAFAKRRIKELIIGSEPQVRNITIEDLKKFYKRYYTSQNCVISVVTSLDYQQVKNIIINYLGDMRNSNIIKKKVEYEKNKQGFFVHKKSDLNGTKIQFCSDIHDLSRREVLALKLFNIGFGEGTSSVLYDTIRTQNALAYEVGSNVKSEKGIMLFDIMMGCSDENGEKAAELILQCIEKVKEYEYFKNLFSIDYTKRLKKSFKLKQELKLEKSIVLSNSLNIYEIMYGDCRFLYEDMKLIDEISPDEMFNTISKALNNPTIQMLTSFNK